MSVYYWAPPPAAQATPLPCRGIVTLLCVLQDVLTSAPLLITRTHRSSLATPTPVSQPITQEFWDKLFLDLKIKIRPLLKRVRALSGFPSLVTQRFTPVFLFLAAPLEGANFSVFGCRLFQSVSLLSSSGFVFRSRLFFSAPAPSLRGFLTCFWQVTYFSLFGSLTKAPKRRPFKVPWFLASEGGSGKAGRWSLQRLRPLKLISTKTGTILAIERQRLSSTDPEASTSSPAVSPRRRYQC